MIETVSLEKLYEMEARNEPSVVFHGTSSCYAEQIERNGWPVNWRPFEWEDIRFVIALTERHKVGGDGFLYFNHDSQCKRLPNGSGGYFTYILEGAVQYSGATAGETVRCALKSARKIRAAMENKPEHQQDCQRLSELITVWNAWVFDSVPVVYAVRITDDAFPVDRFPGIVSKSRSSFAYQIKNWGKVSEKAGDFWATKSIDPSAIIAKAILPSSLIEAL